MNEKLNDQEPHQTRGLNQWNGFFLGLTNFLVFSFTLKSEPQPGLVMLMLLLVSSPVSECSALTARW